MNKERKWVFRTSPSMIGYIKGYKDTETAKVALTNGKLFLIPLDELEEISYKEARDLLIPVADLSTEELKAILQNHGEIRRKASLLPIRKKKAVKGKAKSKKKEPLSQIDIGKMDSSTIAMLKKAMITPIEPK